MYYIIQVCTMLCIIYYRNHKSHKAIKMKKKLYLNVLLLISHNNFVLFISLQFYKCVHKCYKFSINRDYFCNYKLYNIILYLYYHGFADKYIRNRSMR